VTRLRIVILGSTGSIGRQALDVVSRQPDRLEVVALAAGRSAERLAEQGKSLGVTRMAMSDEGAAARLSALLPDAVVGSGARAVEALARETDADIVLNALVGAAGLRASVATLEAHRTLALANKESLVAGGHLVTDLATPGQIVPVDSEHSAIHQCLVGEDDADVRRLWLTASGGPFRDRTREELQNIGPSEALAHPTWSMGPKITVDSATLMNKGLETIEAHHLFGVGYDDIRIVVHPQSCVHSMVEFADGSVKAHLGATDMRIPIQYAFSHPRRWPSSVQPVDFTTLGRLDFSAPDLETFRCLALALEAGRAGGTMPAVMNAANEIAVAAFLDGKCSFLGIADVVEKVMELHAPERLESLEQVDLVDSWARQTARSALD
jgi:1-deoxy-D-xylulose-5-phosphate reductoisomerase